jgi:glycosyltransferase involved in cell wall biosynthesis
VIPNGIDPVQFFKLDSNTVRLIQEQNLFDAEFLMVQPSRLHPRKNMELSINVTRALQDLGIHARLLITGAHDPHGPKSLKYFNRLKKLAYELSVEEDILIMAEYVFKNGERLPVDRITIRDLYLIADVLFLPSRIEGFGIPLLESGMIKLPIVCSNIPPFLEIAGNDVCLFSLNDPPVKIARMILDFTSHLKSRRMFRKVIRSYALENIYQDKISPFLDEVVNTARRKAV